MSRLDEIVSRCDSWEESKHPRDHIGQFSTGGGGRNSGANSKGKSKAEFVNDFMKGHLSRENDLFRLSQVTDDNLKKALEVLQTHNVNDDDAKYMRELIRDVLKSSK